MPDLSADLVRAAFNNRPDDVRALLAQGADPNAKGASQWPITAAYQSGSIEIFEMLLAAGARPEQDLVGLRGPQLAAMQGRLALLRHLLANGHDLLVVGENKTRALDLAQKHRQVADFFTGLHELAFVGGTAMADRRAKLQASLDPVARAQAEAAQEASAAPSDLPPSGPGPGNRAGTVLRAVARALGPLPDRRISELLADHAHWLSTGGVAGPCMWQSLLSGISFAIYAGPQGTEGTQANLGARHVRGGGLAGADLRRAHLVGLYAPGADLRGADLTSAMATDCDLRGADLRGARLTRADFSRSDLRGARLDGAECSFTDFEKCDLSGASLEGAGLRGTMFPGARFAGSASVASITLRDPREPATWEALAADPAPDAERLEAARTLLATLDEAGTGPGDTTVAQAIVERLVRADPASCLPLATDALTDRSAAAEVFARALDRMYEPGQAEVLGPALLDTFRGGTQAARTHAEVLGRIARRLVPGPELEGVLLAHFAKYWDVPNHPAVTFDEFLPAIENLGALLGAVHAAVTIPGLRPKLRTAPSLAEHPAARITDRATRAALAADAAWTVENLVALALGEEALWCFLVSVDWDRVPRDARELLLPRLARGDADDAAARALRRIAGTRGLDLGTREYTFVPTGLPGHESAAATPRYEEVPPPPLFGGQLQPYVESALGLGPEDGLPYWKDGAWNVVGMLPDVPGRLGKPPNGSRQRLLDAAAAPPEGDARRLTEAGMLPVALASDPEELLFIGGDERGGVIIQLRSARTTEGTIPLFVHGPADLGVLRPIAASFTELVGRVSLEVWGDLNGCRTVAREVANARRVRFDTNWLHGAGSARVTDPGWRTALGLPALPSR